MRKAKSRSHAPFPFSFKGLRARWGSPATVHLVYTGVGLRASLPKSWVREGRRSTTVEPTACDTHQPVFGMHWAFFLGFRIFIWVNTKHFCAGSLLERPHDMCLDGQEELRQPIPKPASRWLRLRKPSPPDFLKVSGHNFM